ncbi:VOC family protein [Paenibacillus sp. GCM10027628]|uniref:VOC family protein n=1 Tax=Paenibacillus sp. GCM10027628 TaxID=3273413 RepID=UPI003641D89B
MVLGINPYITLDGQGRDAIKFYEDAVDAKVAVVQTFGEMPANPEYPLPTEAKDRILHALLKVGDNSLMISDTFPGHADEVGAHVSIAIMIGSVEKSKQVYEKLQQGGQVKMPLQETFWSPSYGIVTDKFGVTWQISTEVASK